MTEPGQQRIEAGPASKDREGTQLRRDLVMFAAICALALSGAVVTASEPLKLTLEQSISVALEKSPAVRIARQQVAKAAAAVREARSAKYPVIEGSVTHQRTGPIPTFEVQVGPVTEKISIGTPESTLSRAQLTLPVDISGLIATAQDAAELQYLGARFALEQARQQVALAVEQAYLNVLRAEALDRVARESLESAQEHLRLARARFEAGVVPQFDVLRAEVQLANFRQQAVASANAVKLAYAALNRAMGTDVETALTLVEPPEPGLVKPDPDESLAEALKQHPEALQAAVLVKAASKGVRLARAGLRPSLALVAGQNWQSPVSSFAGRPQWWDVTAALSLPLFDSGATRAKVKQAMADAAAAKLAEEDVRQQISLEVTRAVLNIAESQERLRTADRDVEQAREALRLAQVRYKAGVSTAIEVTDAEVALTQALTNRVNALYDYELALASYNRALGRPVAGE